MKSLEGYFLDFFYSRGVAKWMKNNLNNDNQSDCGPKSMSDYNYFVSYQSRIVFPKFLRTRSQSVTTIDQIWDCFQNSHDKSTLKDICMSFALFELLKRRYFGFICAEAGLRRTQDFVFKVLMPHPDDDYKRAFRIVETELGFCYDFLFTRYSLIYTTGLSLQIWISWYGCYFLPKIILICVVGVYALKKSLILETSKSIIEVHSANADYIIAVTFLCIILIVKLLQVFFYLASDWFKVSLACRYVKLKNCVPVAFIVEKVLGVISRITISTRLRNTIGRCSFIFDLSKSNIWTQLMSFLGKNGDHVKTSDAVKKAIARSLVSTAGKLTNGETSLRKYRMYDEYSWTLKDHSQMEAMLIWHIATDYCVLAST